MTQKLELNLEELEYIEEALAAFRPDPNRYTSGPPGLLEKVLYAKEKEKE